MKLGRPNDGSADWKARVETWAVSGEPWRSERQLATWCDVRHDSVEKEKSGKEVENREGLCNFARKEMVQQ